MIGVLSSAVSRSGGRMFEMARDNNTRIGGYLHLYFGLVGSSTMRNYNCSVFFIVLLIQCNV